MQELPAVSSLHGMSALQDLGPFSSQTEVTLVLESLQLAPKSVRLAAIKG